MDGRMDPTPLPASMAQSVMKTMQEIDTNDKNLWMCVFLVMWTPGMWNVICRVEYSTRVFTNLFGSPKLACFCLSWLQIASSNLRNYYFNLTLQSQARFTSVYDEELNYLGYVLLAVGGLLVVTSFMRLGWLGTWHGDHFGILLPAKVTGFPFNVVDHPMYVGAVLSFLGLAAGNRSVVGVLLSVWTHLVYIITEMVEGPFTEMIYAKAASDKKSKKSK